MTASSSSDGSTALAANPCFNKFSRQRFFPSSVTGPRLLRPFSRLALLRASLTSGGRAASRRSSSSPCHDVAASSDVSQETPRDGPRAGSFIPSFPKLTTRGARRGGTVYHCRFLRKVKEHTGCGIAQVDSVLPL